MTKEAITERFDQALKDGSIYVCFQPQINHMTGRMMGAEALMRWDDPEHGPQLPSDFIPILEEADLIFPADLFVFREVCDLIRKCRRDGRAIVPVSVNMSRYDIINGHGYVSEIEKIRKENDVPVNLLRIEITESSAVGGVEVLSSVLAQLHEIGYIVEMDDFGSGYSTLNVLKDIDVDVIKLDMSFLDGKIGGRGGTIVSSMVQMSKWLKTPVIAEGVETLEQADYMKSIGCFNVQGYLYSKPVAADEFFRITEKFGCEPEYDKTGLLNDIDNGKFWDPDSMETLLFNNFVGPAAIFSYEDGRVELLRINPKFAAELGMNTSEQSVLEGNLFEGSEDEDRQKYDAAIKRAIESRDEEECESWHEIHSDCCGMDKVCLRSSMRLIGVAGEQYLFYVRIKNITAEKIKFEDLMESEKKFRMASEHTNTFAWEYDIATKKMRPCSRCRRELGLPEVIENYPEPLIETGFFPEEIADKYRDWMKRLEDGEEHIEGILPLTEDRLPFMVRYTNEYDESGKPYKAYGSATEVKGYDMSWYKKPVVTQP